MQTPAASSRARQRVLAALLFASTLVPAPPMRGQDLVVDNGATDTVTATQGSGIYDNIIVGNSGGGTVNQSGGNLFAAGNFEMGVGSLSSATYTLSGGTLTVQGQALIGINAFEVTFKQSGGSFTVNGDLLQIGGSTFDNAIYTMTGGSISANQIQIEGEIDQSAGTVTTNGHALLIDTLANTFGFYNLSGGTLTVGSIGTGNSSAESTINWNGGTIQAGASTTSFLQGLTYVRVGRNGGATFDTNGYDVTVAQALIHSTNQGEPAIDGGLTKNGAGTLTLSGANTYNGTTTVNAGTLVFADHTPASANLGVAGGATLEYNVSNGNSLTHGAATITGAGTLVKSGPGTLTFGGSGTVNWNLGAGALIDVTGGTLAGGNFGQDVWTNNLASLTVASGATFRGVEANVQVDALNGAGTVSTGYDGAGYQSFTVGVNGGLGHFQRLDHRHGQHRQHRQSDESGQRRPDAHGREHLQRRDERQRRRSATSQRRQHQQQRQSPQPRRRNDPEHRRRQCFPGDGGRRRPARGHDRQQQCVHHRFPEHGQQPCHREWIRRLRARQQRQP